MEKGTQNASRLTLHASVLIIYHDYSRLLCFFLNQRFQNKNLWEYHQLECHTHQARRFFFSGILWVQTFCKGYQQATIAGTAVSTGKGK